MDRDALSLSEPAQSTGHWFPNKISFVFKPEPLQLGNEGHLVSRYKDCSATATLFIILWSNAALEAFSQRLSNQLYYSQALGEMTQKSIFRAGKWWAVTYVRPLPLFLPLCPVCCRHRLTNFSHFGDAVQINLCGRANFHSIGLKAPV